MGVRGKCGVGVRGRCVGVKGKCGVGMRGRCGVGVREVWCGCEGEVW